MTLMGKICPKCKAVVMVVGVAVQCICGTFVYAHGALPDDGPHAKGIRYAMQLRKAEAAVTSSNTTIIANTGHYQMLGQPGTAFIVSSSHSSK